MKKMKTILTMVVMMMVLSVMTPVTAFAASKKNKLTVEMTNETGLIATKKLVDVGESIQLRVKYNGKNVTKKAVYKTSNKKIIAISKKGKLTPKKDGKCTITVKYKGQTVKWNLKSHTHKWVDDGVLTKWVPAGDGPAYYEVYCYTCNCLVEKSEDFDRLNEECIYLKDYDQFWPIHWTNKKIPKDSILGVFNKEHEGHTMCVTGVGLKEVEYAKSVYCPICHTAKSVEY